MWLASHVDNAAAQREQEQSKSSAFTSMSKQQEHHWQEQCEICHLWYKQLTNLETRGCYEGSERKAV